MKFTFRKATMEDASFLAKVIMEAEKSGSEINGLCTIFDLTESDLKRYIIQMFDEEIEGCEFSIDSFIVAENDGELAGAFGGWIEMENEDEQSSAFLKANLFGFTFPREKIQHSKNINSVLEGLHIEKQPHTHQLEYGFVESKYRGHRLISQLIDEHIKLALSKNSALEISQVPVFGNNTSAIKAYQRSGYEITKKYKSTHQDILKYLSCETIVIMTKKISNG